LPQCCHQSLHLSAASLSIRFKWLLFLFLICRWKCCWGS
jgi:hypothetical protein